MYLRSTKLHLNRESSIPNDFICSSNLLKTYLLCLFSKHVNSSFRLSAAAEFKCYTEQRILEKKIRRHMFFLTRLLNHVKSLISSKDTDGTSNTLST